MKIVISNLTKTYGQSKALISISLTIDGQGVYGLLGRKGAGKSTLIEILATLLTKTSGSVSIDGIHIENIKEIRRVIGYMPQEFSTYQNYSIYEAMDYLALLSDLKPSALRRTIILDLLEKVNLQNHLKTKVVTLSHYMKQRFGIAQALLNNPQLVLLDEPTGCLEADECIEMHNIINNFATNRTIILSTSHLSDIDGCCRNVAILEAGSLLYYGCSKSDSIKEMYSNY